MQPQSKRQKLNSYSPTPPEPVLLSESGLEDTIQTILNELNVRSKVQEDINTLTNEINPTIQFYKQKFHMGTLNVDDSSGDIANILVKCQKLLEIVPVTNSVIRQQNRITDCFSGIVCLLALKHFLFGGDGGLITLAALKSASSHNLDVSDTEYLLGIINFSKELERYAVGRATFGDIKSVVLCKAVVTEILEELMKFDFRNGPIRRQYDGVKYCKKRLEDILYELSLGMNESNSKQFNAPTNYNPLSKDEFKGLQDRMKEYDQLRENVIKQSRDIQKLGKNCVYSLHRGGKSILKAREQLIEGKQKAIEIASTYLKMEPTLRNGTYANAIEEWAEGRIYEEWLKCDDSNKILSLREIRQDIPELTIDEYLGGLGDFTGEVGRFAVAAATRRDKALVTKARIVVMNVSKILLHINMNGKVPSRMFKKISTLRNNLKKLELLSYELSLVKGSIATDGASTGVGGNNKKSNDDDDDE
jgi:predicted translin family RNA/ssDNA-binding protein